MTLCLSTIVIHNNENKFKILVTVPSRQSKSDLRTNKYIFDTIGQKAVDSGASSTFLKLTFIFMLQKSYGLFAFSLGLSLTGGLSSIPSSLSSDGYHCVKSIFKHRRRIVRRDVSKLGLNASFHPLNEAVHSQTNQETASDECSHEENVCLNYCSGGSQEFSHAIGNETDQKNLTGMSIALFAAHFSAMAAKCSLPCSFALLLSPESGIHFSSASSPQLQMSLLLFLSTLSIATGKMCFGPIIDKVGGVVSLQMLLLSLSILLSIIGLTKNFTVFAICWILVDACFSTCWPGCLKCVYQTFNPNMWPKKIGMLALAARTGNAVAFLAFGSILQVMSGKPHSWRLVFGLSALLQLVPYYLIRRFGKSVDQSKSIYETGTSSKSTLHVLYREIKTFDFWLVLLSRSASMIFGNFLLFLPTFMTHGYSLSHAFSSKVASMFAIGCLLSVSIFSNIYNDLSTYQQGTLIAVLCSVGVASVASQLLHAMSIIHISPILGSLIMMLWGFSFSFPFYIPPALFALKRGGNESSATIGMYYSHFSRDKFCYIYLPNTFLHAADVFDVGAFMGLAVFNGYVASIRHDMLSSWIPTFKILLVCASVITFSLPSAIIIGGKNSRENFLRKK